MGHNAYPVTADLAAYLTQTNLDVTGIDFGNAIATGIARFERETGRRFLAPGGVSTRTFDPPLGTTRQMDLRDDLCTITSVTGQGVALVRDADYRLLPQDAAPRGLPWNRIELATRYYSPLLPNVWGGIAVTGTWAYGTTIPDDAWEAMIAAGALDRLPQLILLWVGGLISWTEADTTESYGPKPFDWLREQWTGMYESAAARYRRVTVGM